MSFFEREIVLPNVVWSDLPDKRIILTDNGKSISHTYIAESLVEGKWICIGKSTSYGKATRLCFPLKARKKRKQKDIVIEAKVPEVVNRWIIKNG